MIKRLCALAALAGGVSPPVTAEPDLLGLSAYIIFDVNAYQGELVDEPQGFTARGQLSRLKVSFATKPFDKLKGKLSLEYDNKGRFGIDDAYLEAELGKHIGLIAGRFKEPFGLENMESLRYQIMLERSPATNSFTFGRNYGIDLYTHGKAWRLDMAATRVNADNNDFQDSIAYTSRLGVRVLEAKRFFLHLGAAASKRNTPSRRFEIDEPLIAPAAGNSIHSDELRSQEVLATGLEFALRTGPVLAQAEYFKHDYQLRGDRGKAAFDGYYTSLVWTIFGDVRDWDDGWVEFNGSKRQTLELGMRYSDLDLTHNGDGDMGKALGMVLNYYVRDRLRLSLEVEAGRVLEHDDGEITKLTGESFNTRIMFAF